MKALIVSLLILCTALLLIRIGSHVLRSPFRYPYFRHSFDISGKKSPQLDNLLDQMLIEEGFARIEEHHKKVQAWKRNCKKSIEGSLLRGYRRQQFEACLDDENAYQFVVTRNQTRYKQHNYQKIAYKVTNIVDTFSCSYDLLKDRDRQLHKIGYGCTIRQWNQKDQRKLMTKELRTKIARRDKYTCQICGKYMPDGVGLQIDHIIPVSKGGKSVPENLQVLCSKCNGTKGNR